VLINTASREAFRFYKSIFKQRFHGKPTHEVNAILDERAGRRLFSVLDTSDKYSFFGCQMAGSLCAMDGGQDVFESNRIAARAEHREPTMTNHMLFVRATSFYVFKPYQFRTKCYSPGVEFSMSARQAFADSSKTGSIPWPAVCKPQPFF
jgi:hypothetical protein